MGCETSNEDPLNIKQKYRPNTNNRFGLKLNIKQENPKA